MLNFILRRLGWAVITVFGVMIITFLLFRVVAKDVAAANVGFRATEQEKATWRHQHGYDRPAVFNLDQQLVFIDKTKGPNPFMARDPRDSGSNVANALALVLAGQGAEVPQSEGKEAADAAPAKDAKPQIRGRYVHDGPWWKVRGPFLSRSTPLEKLTGGRSLTDRPTAKTPQPKAILGLSLANGKVLQVDLGGVKTAGELMDRVNQDPNNGGQVLASISDYSYKDTLITTQFFGHLRDSAAFQSRSFTDGRLLLDIIWEKGPTSLAIQIPALAFEFVLGLALAAVVAYFRGTMVDKAGVFLSVLGMYIPFLAFMIFGQYLMFLISPKHAYGIFYRANVYLPVAIMVVAGLGGMVRFYRTIILDETNRDYVRTARAKGLPLSTVLFKHVLRNCMLPILTNLVLTIPFLIMGGLLVETYFGVPGLGDLMLTSITNGNEPIVSGLVFLTAVVYTLGTLVTDISYAIFDPRVRLG